MAEYIEREAAIESLPVAWDSAINALRNAPDVGKTVFRTREEAEKALEEKKGD